MALALMEVIRDLPREDQEFLLRSTSGVAHLDPERTDGQQCAVGAVLRCAADLGVEFPSAPRYRAWRAARLEEGEDPRFLPADRSIVNRLGGSWAAARGFVTGDTSVPNILGRRGRRLGRQFTKEEKVAAVRRFAAARPSLVRYPREYDAWVREEVAAGRITTADRVPRASTTLTGDRGPGAWRTVLAEAGLDPSRINWSSQRTRASRVDVEVFVRALLEAYTALCRPGEYLSARRYDRWRQNVVRQDPCRGCELPSWHAVRARLDDARWEKVCADAGLPARPGLQRSHSVKIERAEMRTALLACAKQLKLARPSYTEYRNWRMGAGRDWRPGSRFPAPSTDAMRRDFAGAHWREIVEQLLGPGVAR